MENTEIEIVLLENLEIYEKSDAGLLSWLRRNLACSCLGVLQSVLPAAQWLAAYRWRAHLPRDLLAGVHLALYHVPQAMANGFVGLLGPVVGLYMAFFPPLVYFLFGSVRHNSIGSFSVISLMQGELILQNSDGCILAHKNTSTMNSTHGDKEVFTRIEVAIALSFTVALFHIGMYILRLGYVTKLLSETVMSSCLAGCAIHVIMSSIKDIFGLKSDRTRGYFSNIYMAYNWFMFIPIANIATSIISCITIVLLVCSEYYVVPYVKKSRIPIPTELLIMIAVIFYTKYGKFRKEVDVVGFEDVGLPTPVIPPLSLIHAILFEAFKIAIVSYIIDISVATLYPEKEVYEFNYNQEFLALGLCNLFGSFFSCMPCSAAYSRTTILHLTGGLTQIANLVNCIIILIVLLWVSHLFYYLPKCVLACVVVVETKSMLLEIRMAKKYWSVSKLELSVWALTFLAVTLCSIASGLAAGVVLSILAVAYESCRPDNCLLGVLDDTDTYLDLTRYEKVEEIDDIKIFHFVGCINFITKATFRKELLSKVNLNPRKYSQKKKRRWSWKWVTINYKPRPFKYLILDLSAITYVDIMGVDTLLNIYNDFKTVKIDVYLVCTSGRVYDNIVRFDLYVNKSKTFLIFPTIHDAVLYAQQQKENEE